MAATRKTSAKKKTSAKRATGKKTKSAPKGPQHPADIPYNYERFATDNYNPLAFPGPKAGEKAPMDFTFTDLDGNRVNLSDYKGKWVVIETGSLTCGMYVKNVKRAIATDAYDLMEKYPDVEFLTVYVREAHPGSKQGPSTSMKEKIKLAKQTKEEYDDPRTFLVDDIEGEFHMAYGGWPNMVYVINPEGKVVYRCDWAMPNLIDDVLKNRDKFNKKEHEQIITAPLHIMIPVVLKGGWDALWDLVKYLPKLTWMHILADWNDFKKRHFGGKKKEKAV